MNLNFFTAGFPYNDKEPIIDSEIEFLEEAFDHISIFPFDDKDHMGQWQGRISKSTIINVSDLKVQGLTWYDRYLIFYFLILEFLFCKKKVFFLKNIRLFSGYLKSAASTARKLSNEDVLNKDAVNYSYWMNDWALVLAFLRKREVISNFMFRCGGFDIWDERNAGNYLPFRGLIYYYADAVYPNAKIAAEYVKKKTKFKDKVGFRYLATSDYGYTEMEEREFLTIVSCSSLLYLKRVELIVDIISSVKVPVKWVHFGGKEKELAPIWEAVASKVKGHQVELKGMVANSDLYEYYKANRVDLLINVSSSEGLPVSIQEAISFGIPIIATDVGGVSEVVNSHTGVLIDKNFDAKKVATIIDNWRDLGWTEAEKRRGVRLFWEQNFDAKKVYVEFVKDLKSIN